MRTPASPSASAPRSAGGITAPLGKPVFRAIWIGSLFANFGLLVQGVGSAWAMTQMGSPDQVALIQTATFGPYMLFAIPAGAIADMYDRRRVQMFALGFALVGAAGLALMSWAALVTPAVLLGFCFLIGTGMAVFSPAWQSSTREQVEAKELPAAIALNSISYNIARAFGPAVGGLIVAVAGVSAAFLCNVVFYIPLLFTLWRWKRAKEPARLPPEGLQRAILSGWRYVVHSPPIRAAILRSFLIALCGVAPTALMPLIAKDLLHGDATTFGLLLGTFGLGAVMAASLIARVRERLSEEAIIRRCGVLLGLAVLGAAASRWLPLTALALFVAGANWMFIVTSLNVSVQVPSPRWVTGRTLAIYQAAIAGGLAIGSWIWGIVADAEGTALALVAAGCLLIVSPVLGLFLKLRELDAPDDAQHEGVEPEVALAITDRSGPIVIEIEYRVPLEDARAFYRAMQAVERTRMRNGGYGWSLSRGIAEPELWVERFHCPTWLDYLRQRSRATQKEREEADLAMSFHRGDEPVRVRRTLERPFGSVRWTEDAPDNGASAGMVIGMGAIR